MAIAFDAFSNITQTTGDMSFTHTPVGTPRGILVYIVTNGVNITVSGVTYGGVAMTQAANSPVTNVTGELGSTHCYFLGSSIPTGAQTVAIDMLLGTEISFAGCVSVTAGNDTSVVTTGTVLNDNLANPAVTLSLGGVSSFCMIGAWSGQNNPASDTPFASWTSRAINDFGVESGLIFTYDTIGTADVSAGYTAAADDVALHAIAIRENAGGATGRLLLNAGMEGLMRDTASGGFCG